MYPMKLAIRDDHSSLPVARILSDSDEFDKR
jgi:hypothetical protein